MSLDDALKKVITEAVGRELRDLMAGHFETLQERINEIPSDTISKLEGFKARKSELDQTERELEAWKAELQERDNRAEQRERRVREREEDLEMQECQLAKRQKRCDQIIGLGRDLENAIDLLKKKEKWIKKHHQAVWSAYQNACGNFTQPITTPGNVIQLLEDARRKEGQQSLPQEETLPSLSLCDDDGSFEELQFQYKPPGQ